MLTKLKYSLGLVLFLATSFSCLKDNNAINFDNLPAIVEITNDQGKAVSISNTNITGDVSEGKFQKIYYINYAAKGFAPQDITVTIGFDESKFKNSYDGSVFVKGSVYEKFPNVAISKTQLTIKKGQRYSDSFVVTIDSAGVNSLNNYAYPISILSTTMGTISGNFGTLMYNYIGNPISGAYDHCITLRDNLGDGGTKTDYSQYFSTGYDTKYDPTHTSFISIDAKTVKFTPPFGSVLGVATGVWVVLTDDGSGNYTAQWEDITKAAKDLGVASMDGPVKLLSADKATKTFVIKWAYTNTAGASRVIVDIIKP